MGRGRKPAQRAPAAEMAPGATASTASKPPNKQIPLLCSVCPDAPRFSDVSHLLTHIASKGHLHHETQTKLRSHQDLAASVALQSYEDWYSQNGIEALLVERMKAKQQKEAIRTRRNRSILSASAKEAKRRSKRSSGSSSLVKIEEDDMSSPYPIHPSLYNSEDEVDGPDDFPARPDMMSLKGQIWPGMGKMDLANEEMKRTRNQRKPKSVIEKMRRASEVIEPTQVILTADLEVERVKGVYDESSSPVPGQEESTPPRKIPRAKRRKAEPLAEISANIPRQRRPNTRGNKVTRKTADRMKNETDENATLDLSHTSFRSGQDVFRDDDDAPPASYDHRRFPTLSRNEQRFDLHDRLGGMPPLNPISQPNLVSPTPSPRDLSARIFGTRDPARGRMQSSQQPYLGKIQLVQPGTNFLAEVSGLFTTMHANTEEGSFGHMEASYAMKDATIYNASSRLPFATSSQFNGINQESFGLSANNSMHPKQEEYTGQTAERANGNQFLTASGSNPLLSQDRLFLGSYSQAPTNGSLRSLAFTPINRPREQLPNPRDLSFMSSHDESAKPDGQTGDSGESSDFCNSKDLSLPGTWGLQPPGSDLDLQSNLNPEDLRL